MSTNDENQITENFNSVHQPFPTILNSETLCLHKCLYTSPYSIKLNAFVCCTFPIIF